MVLGILAEGESYGYAILRRINELSGGGVGLDRGPAVPVCCTGWSGVGHVGSRVGSRSPVSGGAKYYRVTDDGLGGAGRAAPAVGHGRGCAQGGLGAPLGDRRPLLAVPAGVPGRDGAGGSGGAGPAVSRSGVTTCSAAVSCARPMPTSWRTICVVRSTGLIGAGPERGTEAFLVAVKTDGQPRRAVPRVSPGSIRNGCGSNWC